MCFLPGREAGRILIIDRHDQNPWLSDGRPRENLETQGKRRVNTLVVRIYYTYIQSHPKSDEGKIAQMLMPSWGTLQEKYKSE